ncbi:trypsin-like peptidase domain-containing protein [Erythrobacter sp. JK5]|uniref:trypsin-like peptidase domain-containing protein n=1 Tax=Erythrobacter sp. JK5 TaxID=2829500 RepID=UPI001BAC5D59|nr:trypsin-like peptidase domain-containing protein [Erythrobacter sp. JK5]QUL38271.1 trypsin-like peptidase domain-containing protein [Erythrobacter sp. JK5]
MFDSRFASWGALLLALCALFALPGPATADPGDIDAAARGVVRVVLIAQDGEDVVPVSHGSGFAVTANRIVTNAHVIREALQDDTLRIGIVPSEGAAGAFAKPVAVSPRNDLALLEIVDGAMRLPPLTFAGGVSGDMGEVSAIGYPMNVDLAQGLEIGDIFRAQPPVKSRGFLSGERPSRQFDTILHTAPIARGNSGGPLLDGCGRVLGVNSFGADSDGSDAEFYFAVSLRELLPFLRANDVEPRTNALPCRSIEELNAAERDRFEAQRAEAQARLEAREAELREKRARLRLTAQMEVMEGRENAMALAMVLLLVAIGLGFAAFQLRKKQATRQRAMLLAGLAGTALIGALLAWLTRPSFSEIEERVEAAMAEENNGDDGDGTTASLAGDGTLLCTLVPERSRVTGARTDDVEFDWSADGCVNRRTQYGMEDGKWSRVFVPNEEAAVSVNSYDPQTRIFQTDRYLLRQSAMQEARTARGEYSPPACGVGDAARLLGEQQSKVLSLLPERPNERLVYTCEAKSAATAGGAAGGGGGAE